MKKRIITTFIPLLLVSNLYSYERYSIDVDYNDKDAYQKYQEQKKANNKKQDTVIYEILEANDYILTDLEKINLKIKGLEDKVQNSNNGSSTDNVNKEELNKLQENILFNKKNILNIQNEIKENKNYIIDNYNDIKNIQETLKNLKQQFNYQSVEIDQTELGKKVLLHNKLLEEQNQNIINKYVETDNKINNIQKTLETIKTSSLSDTDKLKISTLFEENIDILNEQDKLIKNSTELKKKVVELETKLNDIQQTINTLSLSIEEKLNNKKISETKVKEIKEIKESILNELETKIETIKSVPNNIKEVEVTAFYANVRSCPSMDCNIEAVVKKGQKYKIDYLKDGWYKLLENNSWISASIVKE